MNTVTRIKTTTPSPYPLTSILADTYDTKTFRFGLPADAALDMLAGDHLYVHATINGKSVKHPDTPSSLPGTAGFFDLTVKRDEPVVIFEVPARPARGRHRATLFVCGRVCTAVSLDVQAVAERMGHADRARQSLVRRDEPCAT